MILGRRVNPLEQEVFKFYPHNPPRRGGHVLVDGVRCRVTSCRVKWDDQPEPDGRRRWTLKSLRVKEMR